MQPPVVQSLDQILAQLDPAYSPQRTVIQNQQATLPGQEAGILSGLDVAKGNAFRDVNTNANSKGLAFSGIPAAEQTRYVGEKYLPAVAGVKSDTLKQRFTLDQALAGLASEQRLKGMDIQGGQQKTLADYTMAEQDRNFKAQQAALDRTAAAAHDAAANAGVSPAAQKVQDVGGVHSFFQSVVGSDGRVSPQSYSQAKALWSSMGYSPTEFDNSFAAYRNPKNKSYKLG